MWRSFFYATGFTLIFVGLQSLVFQRVELASGKDVPAFVKRMFAEPGVEAVPVVAAAGNVERTVVDGRDGRSVFGPSRFGKGGFGGGSFSAAPYRSYSNNRGAGSIPVPKVNLAGYQANRSQGAGADAVVVTRKKRRVIDTKDWMPWSLLAAGTVVVLYTRSAANGSHVVL